MLSNCNSRHNRPSSPASSSQEAMIDANRGFVSAENERIDSYVARRGWKMTKTGTGLRYEIYTRVDTSSPKPIDDDVVFITYSISLLDGTLCYEQLQTPESFRVARDNVESGLHEGIRYMRAGEQARLILPPHLAHGLVGDRDKIPMNASIVYDLKLHRIL